MFDKNPYVMKNDVKGKIITILDGKIEERGLSLIKQISRCVCKNEIHELIITDEEAGPGSQVNKVAYLGFMEIEQGSVMVAGDTLTVADKLIGTVAGFDETHMPNHLNIVIKSAARQTGVELSVQLGDSCVFRQYGLHK
jgi:hypothetical protein